MHRLTFQNSVRLLTLMGALLLSSGSALAKDSGLRSPGGRSIYSPHETFREALDQNRRQFVAEVAAGLAPEGNLGLLLGRLNFPFDSFDVYAGIGFELTPATKYTGSLRYTLAIGTWRPYVNLGYLFKHTYAVGTYSHNVFAEVGHRWLVHRTYHLMFGAGFRRILQTNLTEDSLLHSDSVDPELLNSALNNIDPWALTATFRFSRAF